MRATAPTMAKIIDGVAVAREMRRGLKGRVASLRERGIVPGLAVDIVGDNPASRVYVGNKIRACDEVGIKAFRFDFPQAAGPDEVAALMEALNGRRDVHGSLA